MAETDWMRLGVEAGISLASGLGGLVVGAWKWGQNSERDKQRSKDEFEAKLATLREQTRASMEKHEQHSTSRNELLVEQFKESFEGIRRQIDDHKLDTERRFMLKDDFKDFREEYREDIREIKDAIHGIKRS